MNTELHVNDLIVHGSLSGNDGQVGFVQIGAEVDCESAIQLPLDGCIQWRQSQWLIARIDTRPRLHVRTKFPFESDQVYGGMDLAMFCWFFEVTDSVYVFDLDVVEATEPEPVVTSMHIERVNETIDSAFNPSVHLIFIYSFVVDYLRWLHSTCSRSKLPFEKWRYSGPNNPSQFLKCFSSV